MSTTETQAKAMTKKEVKKMLKKAMKKAAAAQQKEAASTQAQAAQAAAEAGNSVAPRNEKNRTTPSFLSNFGLPADFATGHTQQFIIGALIGAGAAYVLSDEDMRKKIMKSAMKMYASVTGGVEEFKEQMSDLKAEIAAEHGF